MSINPQKHISFDRHDDKIEVIIRDAFFEKTFQKEVSTNNKKELENLLVDLKNKGIDLIGIIKRKMMGGSGWFD